MGDRSVDEEVIQYKVECFNLRVCFVCMLAMGGLELTGKVCECLQFEKKNKKIQRVLKNGGWFSTRVV